MCREKSSHEFVEVAKRFGILEKDFLVDNIVTLHTGGKTVQELRQKISMATATMRKKRADTFFDNLRGRSKIGQGIHDRLEAYVFADGIFSEEDICGMNKHVPIPILVTCARNLTVPKGKTLDLTAVAADWNRGKGDDLVSMLNVDSLHLESGSKIRIRGNIFVMVCQRLYNDGGCIEILPTDFSYDKSFQGDLNGKNGSAGLDAVDAEVTPTIEMEATVLGHFAHDASSHISTDGAPGNHGSDGEVGENGFCGGALKIAEINIRQISGIQPLEIHITGGKGGDGGDGGNGGKGSDGAPGIPARKSLLGNFPAGSGGDGGNGGNGGDGGRGGNGGISSNVYIEVPSPEMVAVTVLPGAGGAGGKGGNGGEAGKGGIPGGNAGLPGKDGKTGICGHKRPASAVFVCGQRL